MILELLLLVILISFSFLISGTETAFFSLTEVEIRRIGRTRPRLKKLVFNLYNERTSFLIALLFLNTFVNVFFVSLFNILLKNAGFIFRGSDIVSVIIITLVLLIMGEITPKIIAVYRTSFYISILPFTYILYLGVRFFSRSMAYLLMLVTGDRHSGELDENELKELLRLIKERDLSIKNEVILLEKYLYLKNLKAGDLSVPRENIEYIDREAGFEDVTENFRKNRFSRLPVINKEIDNIIGMIYFKDMIFLEQNTSIKGIIREVHFINPEIKVFKLLSFFLKNRIHIAVLRDGNNKTTGIITLTDIIEKLLGTLPDDRGME
ncbi:MAG: CNNM domain-containing protein [bacterium]